MLRPAALNSRGSYRDLLPTSAACFTPPEMRTHLARIERGEYAAANVDEEVDQFDDDEELIRESPAAAAERARQFAIVKKLLTAAELGTS
jgi:hypothetical protein